MTQILTGLFIHRAADDSLMELQNCVDTFINLDEYRGIKALESILSEQKSERRFPHWVLNDVRKNLLALGKLPENNPYLNLGLKEYIKEFTSIGSFEMRVNILDYLRLSLKMGVNIDIENIGFFWCMYGRRKDYSVINMHVALKVFERKGFTDEAQSLKRVVDTQNMSEKGIRHLLTAYIDIHEPSIIDKVLKSYDLDELNIIWFNLSSKHIGAFPKTLFNYATNTLFEHNRSRQEVNFRDIQNVFYSLKWPVLLERLKFFRYKIRVLKNAQELEKLEKCEIAIIPFVDDENENEFNSSDYRYKHGILDSGDKALILKKKLSAIEVSGYLNGNYAALEDIDIFKFYSKDSIAKNLEHIFYNAILGKVRSINSFGSLYYLVGNLPELVDIYKEESNMVNLYHSFETFLELSMLDNANNS